MSRWFPFPTSLRLSTSPSPCTPSVKKHHQGECRPFGSFFDETTVFFDRKYVFRFFSVLDWEVVITVFEVSVVPNQLSAIV